MLQPQIKRAMGRERHLRRYSIIERRRTPLISACLHLRWMIDGSCGLVLFYGDACTGLTYGVQK